MASFINQSFPPSGILPNFKASLSISEDSSWILVSQNPDTKNNLPYIQEAGLFFTCSDYYTQRVDLVGCVFFTFGVALLVGSIILVSKQDKDDK